MTFHPLTFDPLQANTTHSGNVFRAGLSLKATARGLAAMMGSSVLKETMTSLDALDFAGRDPTAIGWFLTGGACKWTTGGLQVFDIKKRGSCMKSSQQEGYGVMCGLGPCVMHFPGLRRSTANGEGGVTIAVLVNDVLHGRDGVAEILEHILSEYGYQPVWTNLPIDVLIDARRLSQSSEVVPFLKSAGACNAIIEELHPLRERKADSSRASHCFICCFKPKRAGSTVDPQNQAVSIHANILRKLQCFITICSLRTRER